MKSLLIVGGGFAGVWAALAASRRRAAQAGSGGPAFSITVLSRDPWLTFRPRLYESGLDGLRVPLPDILHAEDVRLEQGTVAGIDTNERSVMIGDGSPVRTLPYDRLILASGSRMQTPEIPGAEHIYSVDTYQDALYLQRHLDGLPWRTGGGTAQWSAVVVGGGFTGIEVATSLVTRMTPGAQRAGTRPRVTIIERAAALAPDLGSAARERVESALRALGVDWQTATSVAAVARDGVKLSDGAWIPAATTIWTGGFRASLLAADLKAERDSAGRVYVDQQLRVRNLDAVYAAGDIAAAIADPETGQFAPMSCQCAIPMGETAGQNAAADLLGQPRVDYRHPGYITCLDLGDAGALFMEGWNRTIKLEGFWGKQMKRHINEFLIDPRQWTKRAARQPGVAA